MTHERRLGMAIVNRRHVCHVSDIYVTYPTLRVGIGYGVSRLDIMSRIGHGVSDLILRVEIRHKCHVSDMDVTYQTC